MPIWSKTPSRCSITWPANLRFRVVFRVHDRARRDAGAARANPRAVLQGGFARRPLATAEVVLAKLCRYLPGFAAPCHCGARSSALSTASILRPAARIVEVFRRRSSAAPIRAAARRALLIHQVDLRPILEQIRQPVLLVCGDSDPSWAERARTTSSKDCRTPTASRSPIAVTTPCSPIRNSSRKSSPVLHASDLLFRFMERRESIRIPSCIQLTVVRRRARKNLADAHVQAALRNAERVPS